GDRLALPARDLHREGVLRRRAHSLQVSEHSDIRFAHHRDLGAGDDAHHARHRRRLLARDLQDACVRVRGSDVRYVAHAGGPDVVDVLAAALRETACIRARHRAPDIAVRRVEGQRLSRFVELVHSPLIPALLMTRPQRSESEAISAANFSGEPRSRVAPCMTMRLRSSGSEKMRRVSWFHQSTTDRGVPAGANRPNHTPASRTGRPASAIVGTSGAPGLRSREVIASARSLPARTCGIETSTLSNIIETCPPTKSCTAGAAPLYGI